MASLFREEARGQITSLTLFLHEGTYLLGELVDGRSDDMEATTADFAVATSRYDCGQPRYFCRCIVAVADILKAHLHAARSRREPPDCTSLRQPHR